MNRSDQTIAEPRRINAGPRPADPALDEGDGARAAPADECQRMEGNYFIAAYPPFSCWTADQAPRTIQRLNAPAPTAAPFGLYLHVPFCAERCEFCYYLSYAGEGRHVDRYLNALITEAQRYAALPALDGRVLDFIYFGGGTPSLLSTARIERLIHGLRAIWPWTSAREITFECAPRSVSESKLHVLRDLGVTRISLGIQQLDDRVLAANGRIHRVRDVESAYAAIDRVGFDVVNVDLIVGLVGETAASFFNSLDRIIAMSPDSITIYQLEIPLNTPLYRRMSGSAEPMAIADWPTKRTRLAEAFDRLERAGYVIDNPYMALRDPARHRLIYMHDQYRGADLLGLGVASFSYWRGAHFQNVASLHEYLGAMREPSLPISRAYVLDRQDQLVREFVLGMKLSDVDVQHLRNRFGIDAVAFFRPQLIEMAAQGLLTFDDRCVRLTRKGMLSVDRLIRRFFLPQHRKRRYS